jgi:hypothetical protein
MITVVAKMQLPTNTTLEAATNIFSSTAPRYKNSQGLIRKYYIFDTSRAIGGGVYLLESKEAALAMFGDTWRNFVTEKYGVAPTLEMYESPVIVDNKIGTIEVVS